MVVDPRTLSPGEGHRRCPRCDYDLAGLAPGTRCPECGTPTRRKARSGSPDNLTDAPLGYLRRLNASCLLLAAGAVFMPALLFATPISGHPGVGLASLFASAVWCLAVWLVTAPRPFREGMAVSPANQLVKTRLIARYSQGAWIPASLCALIAVGAPGVAGFFGVASIVFFMIGAIGITPVAILLAEISDWASDTNLSMRLRVSALSIAGTGGYILFTVFFAGFLGGIADVLRVVAVWAGMVFFISLVVFFIGMLQLASLTTWAIRNAHAALDRDERLAEKAERFADELAGVATAPRVETPEDLGFDLSDEPPPEGAQRQRGHSIKRPDETEAYDVEP